MTACAVFQSHEVAGCEGENVDNTHRGKLDYDIFIRASGVGGWSYGTTAHNPDAAMWLQSQVRYSKPYIAVKIMSKPKGAHL